MKIKTFYCKKLHEDINFDAECIYTCCGPQPGPGYKLPNENTDMKKYCKQFAKWKYRIAKMPFIGKMPKECKNCLELKTKDISLSDLIRNKFLFKKEQAKIKNIIFKSFKQCELACVYCSEKRYTKGKKTQEIQKSDFYNTLPLLKALKDQDLIDNSFTVEFQGGSIQVWDEFIPTLDEIVKYGVKNIIYHTNAFKFVPEIVKYSNINSSISVSIDSGCADTYSKIKGEDRFNTVIENITMYADAGINCTVKYIIVKNLNDNIEEVDKFIKIIDEIRGKIKDSNKINVMVTIDYRESLKQNYKASEENCKLIHHIQNHCNINNIYFEIENHIKEAIK